MPSLEVMLYYGTYVIRLCYTSIIHTLCITSVNIYIYIYIYIYTRRVPPTPSPRQQALHRWRTRPATRPASPARRREFPARGSPVCVYIYILYLSIHIYIYTYIRVCVCVYHSYHIILYYAIVHYIVLHRRGRRAAGRARAVGDLV